MQPLRMESWGELVADRPVAVLDLETTDADVSACEVVELGVAGYGPAEVAAAAGRAATEDWWDPRGGMVLPLPEPAWRHVARLRPGGGRPIHPDATAVHGIRDEDVADKPGIESVADVLRSLAETHTIVTFNGKRFDLRILERLVGLRPAVAVDVMGVWRAALERPVRGWFSEAEEEGGKQGVVPPPRAVGDPLLRAGGPGRNGTGAGRVFRDSLEAAHYGLLGRTFAGAHGSLADVEATARTLFSALALWADLPTRPAELGALSDDALASVRLVEGRAVIVVGKHKGLHVADVYRIDPSYVGWILHESDFDEGDKARVVAEIGQDAVDVLGAARRGRGRRPRAAS